MELAILIVASVAAALATVTLAISIVALRRNRATAAGADESKIADTVSAIVKEQIDGINQNVALLLTGYTSTVDAHLANFEARQTQQGEKVALALEGMSDKTRATLREQREEMERKLEAIRGTLEAKQLENLETTGRRLAEVREEVAKQLSSLREENNKQLDRMREVVDKELHDNLQTKLNQSFRLISDNLAKVYQSMGEMQSMTNDMNDLKRVLSGVKTRGVWGEASLSTLLSDILTPEQYVVGFRAAPRSDRSVVEFAVRLPGKTEGENVYLPIDSKFPREDYERLVNCTEAGDKAGAEAASKALEKRVKSEASDIQEKYIKPPRTTEFAVMYVPIEGLYAEIMRREGLNDLLRNQYHVMVAGPTTLAALLSSLQMGFKTLAVERRSKEIWELLAVIQRQFQYFAKNLALAEKQINTVAKTLRDTGSKADTIKMKLSAVQQLDGYGEDADELPMPADDDTEGDQ